jgi:hypothetical protein
MGEANNLTQQPPMFYLVVYVTGTLYAYIGPMPDASICNVAKSGFYEEYHGGNEIVAKCEQRQSSPSRMEQPS